MIPTIDEIEGADCYTLSKYYRSLSSTPHERQLKIIIHNRLEKLFKNVDMERYPTYGEIERATFLEVCEWYSALPPPRSEAERWTAHKIKIKYEQMLGNINNDTDLHIVPPKNSYHIYGYEDFERDLNR